MLFITDEAGCLLFKSGGLRLPAVPDRQTENPVGLCRIGGHSFYAKAVRLNGTFYRFFLDFDRLCTEYGVPAAARAAEGLFDIPAFCSRTAAKPLPFSAFFRSFIQSCPPDARQRIDVVQFPAPSAAVCVSPNALVLALSVILHLCRGAVRFSFADRDGQITVFADGESTRAKDAPLCAALLSEVCGAAGFALHSVDCGGVCRYTLELAPTDPACFGLKATPLVGCEKNFRVYAACFLSAEDGAVY